MNKNRIRESSLHQGYENYTINGKNKRVHRLVAENFIVNPKPDEYNVVNHIDGNKRNNFYKNLEWCSHSMNAKHAIENNLKPSIKKIVQFDKDFNIINVFNTAKEVGEKLNIDSSNIGKGCSGKYNIYFPVYARCIK